MKEPATPHPGSSSDRYSRAQTITAFVLFGIVVAIFAFGMSYPWLDTQKQQWVTCEVLDAETQRGSNLSSTAWFVSIETTDCGFIAFREGGTSQDHMDQIAESFEPAIYEFKLEMMSRLEIAIKDTPLPGQLRPATTGA